MNIICARRSYTYDSLRDIREGPRQFAWCLIGVGLGVSYAADIRLPVAYLITFLSIELLYRFLFICMLWCCYGTRGLATLFRGV
jgi:hypothetical protein